MRMGHAWVFTLALFELLLQELLPRVAVCRDPLIAFHVSAALLLLRRRRSLLARAIRATSFVIGLRGARQGPQAGGIRRLACSAQHIACGLGRRRPPCGRSTRDHATRAAARGARRRRGAHLHGARPLGADSLSRPRGLLHGATCDHHPVSSRRFVRSPSERGAPPQSDLSRGPKEGPGMVSARGSSGDASLHRHDLGMRDAYPNSGFERWSLSSATTTRDQGWRPGGNTALPLPSGDVDVLGSLEQVAA